MLFCNLRGASTPGTTRLTNEQESRGADAVQQVAKYINGVGDSENFLVKLAGGTIGAGIIYCIIRGSTFVSW